MREFLHSYIVGRNGGSGVSIGNVLQQGAQRGAGQLPPAMVGDSTAETREICSPITKSTTIQTSTMQPTPSAIDDASTITVTTEWMSGGHNQNEACSHGIRAFQAKYPNKTVTRVNSNEESRKDSFGHVEYKYYCQIRIGNQKDN